VPESQKLKKSGLDQYGAERFDRFIYATIRKSVRLKGLKQVDVTIRYRSYYTVSQKRGPPTDGDNFVKT